MNARTAASLVAVVGILGTLSVACTAPVEGTDQASTTTDSVAIDRIMLGGGSSSGGGGSYGGIDGSTCNSLTTCCVGGSPTLMAQPATSDPEYSAYLMEQAAVVNLGCQASSLKVIGSNGDGHWWFSIVCPYNSGIAPWVDALKNGGAGINTEAYYVTKSTPCASVAPAGYITLAFDPTCPTGCTAKGI